MRIFEKTCSCPMEVVLKILMGSWTTYILYVLRNQGPIRFGELKRAIPGISAKVLTQRLRMLEKTEIIKRDYVPTIPPQVTYSLAERGHELRPIIDSLNKIAKRWMAEDAMAKKKSTKRAA